MLAVDMVSVNAWSAKERATLPPCPSFSMFRLVGARALRSFWSLSTWKTRPSPVPRTRGDQTLGRGGASGWDDGGVLQRCAPDRVPEGARLGTGAVQTRRSPTAARVPPYSRSPSPFLPLSSPTTAQGYKHFSLHLRGREELLVTVHHRDSLVDGDAPDARFDRAPSVSDFLPSPSLPVRGFSG